MHKKTSMKVCHRGFEAPLVRLQTESDSSLECRIKKPPQKTFAKRLYQADFCSAKAGYGTKPGRNKRFQSVFRVMLLSNGFESL